MRTRTAATAVLLALAALTAGCGKSDEQTAADCESAISSTSTKTSRPDACKDLSQDDYEALLISWALRDTGAVDDDGNVDLDGLLNDQ